MENFDPTILCFIAPVVAIIGCIIASYFAYLSYVHKLYAHIPGPPRSSFIFGHIADIKKWRKQGVGHTLSEFHMKMEREYGPIYVFFLMHKAVVVISDPVYVKELLITNQNYVFRTPERKKLGFPTGVRFVGDGIFSNPSRESWRSRRRLMSSAFHRKSLKNFMTQFNEVCDHFQTRLESLVEKKQEAQMANEFLRGTLDIISSVLFNINLDAINHPNNRLSSSFILAFQLVQSQLFNSSIVEMFTDYWPWKYKGTSEQYDAINYLREFARQSITKRIEDVKAKKPTPDDLLDTLVKDGTLSMDDIIDEFLSLYLAGHESTGNSLAFALFDVIRHPEVEKKILAEVNEVLGDREYVDYDDLPKLKYLGQVLQESLRIHPITPSNAQNIITKDMTFGGYKVPKGSRVLPQRVVMSRSGTYWKDPQVFDPDRFSNPENIPNFSSLYVPFNIGLHNCLGQYLAKFEQKVIMARVLRKFRFNLSPGQTGAELERMTLVPRDGVICNVTLRK